MLAKIVRVVLVGLLGLGVSGCSSSRVWSNNHLYAQSRVKVPRSTFRSVEKKWDDKGYLFMGYLDSFSPEVWVGSEMGMFGVELLLYPPRIMKLEEARAELEEFYRDMILAVKPTLDRKKVGDGVYRFFVDMFFCYPESLEESDEGIYHVQVYAGKVSYKGVSNGESRGTVAVDPIDENFLAKLGIVLK